MSLQSLIILCVLLGISVFLAVFALFSTPAKKNAIKKEESDVKEDWLYSNFLTKLYDVLFGKYEPSDIAQKFGLKYDKYMLHCSIINKVPDMKKEAMLRVIGVASFFVGALLCLFLLNLIPFIVATAIYFLLVLRIPKEAEKAAEAKKTRMIVELPRFVDLLQSALDIGLPIDMAIKETANVIPCIISDELNLAQAQMEIGAENWQSALENIAHKYEITVFSDFVLDIITSYNKGVSVKDAVARKSYEIKQSALLRAKEKTAKMGTTILIPIMIYKIVPMLGIMLVPIVIQISNTFLG